MRKTELYNSLRWPVTASTSDFRPRNAATVTEPAATCVRPASEMMVDTTPTAEAEEAEAAAGAVDARDTNSINSPALSTLRIKHTRSAPPMLTSEAEHPIQYHPNCDWCRRLKQLLRRACRHEHVLCPRTTDTQLVESSNRKELTQRRFLAPRLPPIG